MTKTISLCPTCYREVEAELFSSNGSMWMVKTCPEHGETRAICETSAAFWLACRQKPSGNHSGVYGNVSLIDITDHCNVQCDHCYHEPDNHTANRSASWIINKALSAPNRTVCLMGAEPTTRDDLPEIIRDIHMCGKTVLIYTNAVKLAEDGYAEILKAANLHAVSISVHDTEYHSKKVFDRVMAGAQNAKDAGLAFGQMSFTVTDLQDSLGTALRSIFALVSAGFAPTDFCIRTPAHIGRDFINADIFVSDLFAAVTELCAPLHIPVEIEEGSGNNPYHVRVSMGGIPVQLIHWPTVHNIDLRQMDTGPWASFIDGTHGSFAVQVIQRDGMKRGWWQGKHLTSSEVTK